MSKTYRIRAWCVRPFITYLDAVEADTPEEAIAIGRTQQEQLLDAAEDCNYHVSEYPWDQFAAYDEDGNESLYVLDAPARAREAAPAQAILLDMLRYGFLTLSDGEAEVVGVIYAFDDQDPDWRAVLDAFGE